jgi:hypothetical protein
MDLSREIDIEARLARVEKALALLQRSVEAILAEKRAARASDAPDSAFAELRREPSGFARPEGGSARAEKMADVLARDAFAWLSSRSPEWWLSRLGIGFVILAVLLLYGFAIDKGWITPPIRVLAGTVLGGVLLWVGARTPIPPSSKSIHTRELGFREVFFGGALAVWYVTAYAAAVWYQLISVPTARLFYLVLGILTAWISLQERREIFAFLAVATSFATPFILTAPSGSLTEYSLFLGAVTAMGLMIYLMRGWPSIVWITYAGFWISVAGIAEIGGRVRPAEGSLTFTALLILATAAFIRVPALRRQLLLLGSERYTPFPLSSGMIRMMDGLDSLAGVLGGGKSAPDSLVIWTLPLLSPILASDILERVWPGVSGNIWGLALIALGAVAFALARREVQPDGEVTHVWITAAVLWTVLGVNRVASSPEGIPLAALVATVVIFSFVRAYSGARVVAKVTIATALMAIAGHELGFSDVGLVHVRWVLSGIATVGCAGLIAQTLVEDPAEKLQGTVVGAAAYLTGLLVMWRALEPIWAPLVTASYAIVGAVLLVLSRRPGANPFLRHLGAATMLLVVARLLLVDLSSVETIWRVLLFLVCGAVFLYTGYRMQPRPAGEIDK